MHHKNKVKKVFKILFVLLQTLIFISSICISTVSITIFYKSKELFAFAYTNLLFVLLMALMSFMSSLLGLKSIFNKNRIYLLSYIIITLVLMNLQAVIDLKISFLPEKSTKWGNLTWDRITDNQKNFIQNKFGCCGFKSINDRPGSSCSSDEDCFSVLQSITNSIRLFVEKSVIFMFFIESISVSIIAILRLRR